MPATRGTAGLDDGGDWRGEKPCEERDDAPEQASRASRGDGGLHAGADVAAHSEPLKLQWPRPVEGRPQEPATLVLRVEGPMALEIQHKSDVILERVNRFLGWSAVGRLALRQAPLSRRDRPKPPSPPDPEAVARIAETLDAVEDEQLRAALARLGAAIKRN